MLTQFPFSVSPSSLSNDPALAIGRPALPADATSQCPVWNGVETGKRYHRSDVLKEPVVRPPFFV
jgi:hypothetical protein